MKELSRLRRSSLTGSTSSLTRRSSISQKDIQVLQETLQKQQKVSAQLVLALLIFVPPASFFIFYSISMHTGLISPTITAIFFRFPFVFQCIPPVWDTVAWKFSIVHCAIQLIFYWVLPHDQALVMSPEGDQIREINSFFSCVLTCLLYVLGASAGIYRGDLVYIHFNSIILIFAIFAIVIWVALIVSYHFGTGNSVTTISEFWFGIENHPNVLDIDLKSFIRTRFTFVIWPLFVISALYYHNTTYGKASTSLICASTVQLMYIFLFHWNEDLYLNSLDSKRCDCGFYRLWADFVLGPIIYTSPINVLAATNRSVGMISNGLFCILAVASMIFTAKCDRQKYEFRKSKGSLKTGDVDAFFISAKYKTDAGETNANLLLGSGHWGVCRHPNYTSEAVSFLAFSAFQGFPSVLAHFPALFVTFFLLARAFTDENRCLIKYGQYWAQYCSKVKYRFLPGVL
uniref:7-dehydrocholesterol reductase n=1 Tax=Caenorhabditis tropicalis TaxID=1561998 RepID=A0A1I7V322_9PELO